MASTTGAEHLRSRRAWLTEIRPEILELVKELQAIDIRAYEALDLDDQVRRILPIASALLARGDDLVDHVVASSEPAANDTLPPGLSFELTMDAAVEQNRSGVVDVSDIAFCAHLELRQRKQRLAEVADAEDAITLLSECDGALRRLHKALCALDVAIAAATSSKPWLDFTPELQRSLRVRRCYARVHASVLGEPDPGPTTLVARLRRVGTTIAVLVGQPVYAELRVGDRLQLRYLQRRVLDWLRASHHVGAEVSGFELWSDVKAFVSMLQQVNRRQELLEHDADVLREAFEHAQRSGYAGHFPAALQGRLELLAGLDAEIDALLRSESAREIAVWRPVLAARPIAPGVRLAQR